MPPGVGVAESEEGEGLLWPRSRTSDAHGGCSAAVELSSSSVSKMDQGPASLVGSPLLWHTGARIEPQPKPQSQPGPEFAGFWVDQNFAGNKPVELPRPLDETKPVARDHTSVTDSPKPTEKTPLIAAERKHDLDASIRSKRFSTVSQECLLGQGQGQGANTARAYSVESFQRQRSSKGANDIPSAICLDGAIRRVDEASILSSRRSAYHSSRSLCQGSLLEETLRNNPPRVLPRPPGSDEVIHVSKPAGSILKDEIFPGSTTSLAHLRTGNPTEPLSRLSKEPVLGGSYRVTRSCDALGVNVSRVPTSLPSSPRASSKESRASKLLRKFKLSGIGARVGTEADNVDRKLGKRSSSIGVGKLSKEKGSKAVNNPSVSQHQKLVKSWESQKPEPRYGVRSNQDFGNRMRHAPTIHSECMKVDSTNSSARLDSSAKPSVRSQEGNAALQEHTTRTSSSRWLFKWKWGSKPAAKVTTATAKRVVNSTNSSAISGGAYDGSPTADIMSDARNTLYTKSDRFWSAGIRENRANSGIRSRHRRGSSWGCASHAATAALTPGSLHCAARATPRSRFQDAMESSQANGSQSFRVREGYQDRQESFRSIRGRSFRSSVGGQSFRNIEGQSFRSTGSFRKGELFEDCHGSFRSIGSPGSYGGSFRSVDSLSFRSVGTSNRFPSVEEMEWDSRLPPPLQGDQNVTIDVAALCNSSLKFVFKCREIQHFNRFLRTQKKRLLSAESEKGNIDCFHVILSGTDIEVSSMVTAMCYAWFLENTVPKVTGETWHAIPVIDIPRHQMHKHKDAAWLFDACGIDAATFLFADEIKLASLVEAGRIKISAIGQDALVTRNEVGSVCTLLGEKLLAEAQCLLEPRYMKTLLLAGILLDTENLDFASMRDTEMTTMLLVGSGSLGRNGFFDQLKGVEDDERVSKFITRNYGAGKQPESGGQVLFSAAQSKVQEESADHEQSDKDSLFTQSQDQTSTSEAGTSSSLDEEYSPRLKQRSSFKYTRLTPHSAPARSHQLPSPSSAGCNEDEMAVAHLRKSAVTRSASSLSSGLPGCGARSPSVTRIRKRLFLYQA